MVYLGYMLSRSPISVLDGLIFLILYIVYGQGQGIDVLGATHLWAWKIGHLFV